jgi:hypothetical protein
MNKRRKHPAWLLLILILGLTACAGIMSQNELVVTDQFEGVIFAQEDEHHWTPSRAEVLALEERLGPYLQEAVPQDYPGPLKSLSAYKRQYQGIWVKGQQVIAVNFFCEARRVDWQRQIVFVADGGSCYFEVKYDVVTGQFSNLSIHGEA